MSKRRVAQVPYVGHKASIPATFTDVVGAHHTAPFMLRCEQPVPNTGAPLAAAEYIFGNTTSEFMDTVQLPDATVNNAVGAKGIFRSIPITGINTHQYNSRYQGKYFCRFYVNPSARVAIWLRGAATVPENTQDYSAGDMTPGTSAHPLSILVDMDITGNAVIWRAGQLSGTPYTSNPTSGTLTATRDFDYLDFFIDRTTGKVYVGKATSEDGETTWFNGGPSATNGQVVTMRSDYSSGGIETSTFYWWFDYIIKVGSAGNTFRVIPAMTEEAKNLNASCWPLYWDNFAGSTAPLSTRLSSATRASATIPESMVSNAAIVAHDLGNTDQSIGFNVSAMNLPALTREFAFLSYDDLMITRSSSDVNTKQYRKDYCLPLVLNIDAGCDLTIMLYPKNALNPNLDTTATNNRIALKYIGDTKVLELYQNGVMLDSWDVATDLGLAFFGGGYTYVLVNFVIENKKCTQVRLNGGLHYNIPAPGNIDVDGCVLLYDNTAGGTGRARVHVAAGGYMHPDLHTRSIRPAKVRQWKPSFSLRNRWHGGEVTASSLVYWRFMPNYVAGVQGGGVQAIGHKFLIGSVRQRSTDTFEGDGKHYIMFKPYKETGATNGVFVGFDYTAPGVNWNYMESPETTTAFSFNPITGSVQVNNGNLVTETITTPVPYDFTNPNNCIGLFVDTETSTVQLYYNGATQYSPISFAGLAASNRFIMPYASVADSMGVEIVSLDDDPANYTTGMQGCVAYAAANGYQYWWNTAFYNPGHPGGLPDYAADYNGLIRNIRGGKHLYRIRNKSTTTGVFFIQMYEGTSYTSYNRWDLGTEGNSPAPIRAAWPMIAGLGPVYRDYSKAFSVPGNQEATIFVDADEQYFQYAINGQWFGCPDTSTPSTFKADRLKAKKFYIESSFNANTGSYNILNMRRSSVTFTLTYPPQAGKYFSVDFGDYAIDFEEGIGLGQIFD